MTAAIVSHTRPVAMTSTAAAARGSKTLILVVVVDVISIAHTLGGGYRVLLGLAGSC